MNRVGYVRFTYEDLKNILDLPDEVEVVGVDSGAFVHEFKAVHILLSGPKLPEVPDGGRVPQISWDKVESCKNFQNTT